MRVQLEGIINRALAEDVGEGDVTTEALIAGEQQGAGIIVAKQEGILAGIEVAKQVFLRVDPRLSFETFLEDGARVKPHSTIARVTGNITSILKAERVALNFLQRLSGIASQTNRYVKTVRGLRVRIMDTRKTTPGLRVLEKYAVRVGGGHNHRMSLSDGILIKDNHLAALRSQGLGIRETVARAREEARVSLRGVKGRSRLQDRRMQVEVEVRTMSEALEAVEAGADIVMLDNMQLEDMRKAVESIHGRALVEASGGITLENVRAVAETGVDLISIGALTHSVKALDISLEFEITGK
ncbi:MAG: carboxylating nicotinate-nucleotide diphosphorylase [Dehalococcoidia bacterium]